MVGGGVDLVWLVLLGFLPVVRNSKVLMHVDSHCWQNFLLMQCLIQINYQCLFKIICKVAII